MRGRAFLTVFLVITCANSSANLSGLRQIIARNVTGVQLAHGNIMEIIEEQTCSAALLRLTCRSLTSFVFIIEASYQPNQTDACIYDRNSWCRYRSILAKIKHLQMRRSFLRASYGSYTNEIDDNPLDFRNTLNRRYVKI